MSADLMGLDEGPFRVHPDRTVTLAPDYRSPEVYCELDEDGQIIGEPYVDEDWELLDGFTGQHGYTGPLMHPSEYIGGGMLDAILDTPGLYAVIIPITLDGDDQLDSWVVAHFDEAWRDVEVYADGFGTWHAMGTTNRMHALLAIAHQLAQRGDGLDLHRLDVIWQPIKKEWAEHWPTEEDR